ncbi:MAG TPA: NAD(P)-binding domain-containing protein [Blastocatellia bacterium]|nr:NAD(P)-binding domain-containing protein [Blastocatellia bacterium]
MAGMNRFIIKRKDSDSAVDDIVIESEGLTIGRLISNDLVLNHRAVSRTHAGIKAIKGEFWLFNFSRSNGTYLNNELVEKTPLADGDVIQIGPFVLVVHYAFDSLAIIVERQLQVQAVEGAVTMPVAGTSEEDIATVMMRKPPLPGTQTITPGGSSRLQGTGVLSGVLSEPDEQALEIFWKNRKREAGKIAARTPLHPRGERKFGKAQFNWRPTLDLRRVWRKSYFWIGAVIVALGSVAAYLIYESAYSPGPISSAHAGVFQSDSLLTRNIANQSNSASCSNCHGVTQGMQDKCISCHVTKPTEKQRISFVPTIYASHEREGIVCSSCHTEHQGADIRAGLVSYNLCSNCHNGVYKIKTGERAGSLLPIPHGGTVGYPVENGKWTWKLTSDYIKRKGWPDRWATYEPKDQFHAVHDKDRLNGRISCGDCHTKGRSGDADWRNSPRAECAKCHGVTTDLAGTQGLQANCNTCHLQHGQPQDLAQAVAAATAENKDLKTLLDTRNAPPSGETARFATASANLFPASGAAEVLRQNKDLLDPKSISSVGAVPWYGWVGLAAALPFVGLAVMAVGTARRRKYLKAASAKVKPTTEYVITGSLDLDKLIAEAPPYPRPVIDPVLCIGCHACVEACPHDVLAIVNGISTPIAPDQCMEDTGCTVECPTSPKACIVINTNKKIPARKVPVRDKRFKTNVEGIYLIGDVSGVPLIKNAINEGGQVMDYIIEDLRSEGSNSKAEYDVAIIGVGPAGLSAAVIAKQLGLRYIAIEQDKLVSTIANYPAGKYVFFKPDTVEAKGGIPLPGVGDKKETMIQSWMLTMKSRGVTVNEEERCAAIKRENGCFRIQTEKGKTKEQAEYTARKVILAIGNRGAPMLLRVPGEDLKIRVQPEPAVAKHCPRCGTQSQPTTRFCKQCGTPLPVKTQPPFDDPKVKYKLSDPDDFVGKKCIVVGAGNSAIEAAVDLTGFKREGDSFTFTRTNEVTLVIRSDFKGDLKLGNKMNVYDCIDAGKIKVYFRTEIKEITPNEVILMDVRSKEERARIPNDYVFAMIGGEKPTKFLESIGVKIGEG